MSLVLALASNGGSLTLEEISWVGIPLFIFVAGVVFGLIKFAVRAGHYMAKSQDAQESTANTNTQIVGKLDTYIEKTDAHFERIDHLLSDHDREIAVLRYANGNTRNNSSPVERIVHDENEAERVAGLKGVND